MKTRNPYAVHASFRRSHPFKHRTAPRGGSTDPAVRIGALASVVATNDAAAAAAGVGVGWLLRETGRQNDGVAAIAKIQICLKSDPKSVELIALLARGFVAIGQTYKAVTIYKESARLAGEQAARHQLRLTRQKSPAIAHNAGRNRCLRCINGEDFHGDQSCSTDWTSGRKCLRRF